MNNEEMKEAVWTLTLAKATIKKGMEDVLSLQEKYFEVGDKTKLRIYREQIEYIMDKAMAKMDEENHKVVQEALLEFCLSMEKLGEMVVIIDEAKNKKNKN